jgi:tRNA (mo5U34)-methyltransferase
MRMSELTIAEAGFRSRLRSVRKSVTDLRWYPYSSLNNISILARFLPPDLEIVPAGGSVLDIGAADGDMGFFFQSLGCDVDFLDNAVTNFNDCEGIRRTASLLGRPQKLIERDIDRGFELDRDYDLAIFLGTLYHLRNPALSLVRLAQRCHRALISTRVMSHLPDGRNVEAAALAYLLDTREANDDPTNYWIFSPVGLERLLKRCGWRVMHAHRVGEVGRSNPVDNDADERMFMFCERVEYHADLDKHHEF